MLKLTAAFHRAFGIPIRNAPTIPYSDRVSLRRKLIAEEAAEVDAELEIILKKLTRGEYYSAMQVYEDIARLAKELSDLQYVIEGTVLEFGLPWEAVEQENHRSQMSKLGPSGQPIRRHDGKVLKGPNYREADMLSALGLIEGTTTP